MTASTLQPRRGRPRTHQIDHDFTTTPLYQLLLEKLPRYVKVGTPASGTEKTLDIPALADAIGYKRQSIYRWFDDIRISKRAAETLIYESQGHLTTEDLLPFFL